MEQKSNSDFSIIENTREAQNEYGHNYGSDTYYISKEDIQALLDGKQLACDINGNEYSLFIVLKEEQKMPEEISNLKENIFIKYTDKMKDLYIRKNHDYGDSVSKTFDEYGLVSFLVRMDDKMNRIKTLNKIQDAAVRGEKIEDTLLDLANYAILALTEIEFRKKCLLQNEEYPEKDFEITQRYIDEQGFM